MYCNNCHSNVPDGTLFCPNCGCAIEAAHGAQMPVQGNPVPQADRPAPTSYVPPRRNTMSPVMMGLIVLVVLLLVAVAGMAGYMLSNKDKASTEAATAGRTVVVDTVTVPVAMPQAAAAPQTPPAPAREARPQGVYRLAGSVGRYPIHMELTISGNDVYGSYYYDRYGSNASLSLIGTIQGRSISMYENADNNGQWTGEFNGSFDGVDFTGTMTSYSSGRTFNLHISRVR